MDSGMSIRTVTVTDPESDAIRSDPIRRDLIGSESDAIRSDPIRRETY